MQVELAESGPKRLAERRRQLRGLAVPGDPPEGAAGLTACASRHDHFRTPAGAVDLREETLHAPDMRSAERIAPRRAERQPGPARPGDHRPILFGAESAGLTHSGLNSFAPHIQPINSSRMKIAANDENAQLHQVTVPVEECSLVCVCEPNLFLASLAIVHRGRLEPVAGLDHQATAERALEGEFGGQ